MNDLDRSIVTKEQAVESTPDDHPDRCMYLNNLANALQERFKRMGLMDDFERAIVANEQALACDTAPPSMRLKAANSCSDLLISQKRYSRAKSVLHSAVHLLSTVSLLISRPAPYLSILKALKLHIGHYNCWNLVEAL